MRPRVGCVRRAELAPEPLPFETRESRRSSAVDKHAHPWFDDTPVPLPSNGYFRPILRVAIVRDAHLKSPREITLASASFANVPLTAATGPAQSRWCATTTRILIPGRVGSNGRKGGSTATNASRKFCPTTSGTTLACSGDEVAVRVRGRSSGAGSAVQPTMARSSIVAPTAEERITSECTPLTDPRFPP
jgi:hypothetical protein